MKLGFCYKSSGENNPTPYSITCDRSTVERLAYAAKEELECQLAYLKENDEELYTAFYTYQKLKELLKKEDTE